MRHWLWLCWFKPLFFSLLIITVSFLPVFTLQAQADPGRALVRPTALHQNLCDTLVPVLMGYFIRGGIVPEHRNPINRFMNEAVLIMATLPFALVLIMWGTGTGSEVMQRIGAPMVGGVVSATLLTLVVIPAAFLL